MKCSNYLHSAYLVLGALSNPEMIDVYGSMCVGSVPFYERLKHLWILVSMGVVVRSAA